MPSHDRCALTYISGYYFLSANTCMRAFIMSPWVSGLLVLVVLCEGWIQSTDAHGMERSWRNTQRSSNNSVSGLPSLDEVRGNGSMLLNITTLEGKNDLIFPSLNFTCNGTIKRVIFLAKQNIFSSPNYLDFGLWSPSTHSDILYQEKMFLSISNAVRFEDSGIAYVITPEEASFVEGDVFSIHQGATSLHYHLFFEEKKVYICRNYTTNNITCKMEKIGYPLVAIETGMYAYMELKQFFCNYNSLCRI